MRVISQKRLREFWEEHPDCKESLRGWFRVVEKADWYSFSDIRKTFPSADLVGECLVFNVGGNKVRVIARQKANRIFVLFVLTHAEYNKGKWKKHCNY